MFGFYRIACAVPRVKVADISYNTAKIIESIKRADKKLSSLLIFPELSITGYTCGDLFFQTALLEAAENAVIEIVNATKKLGIVSVVGAPVLYQNSLYNCAIILQKGNILGIVPKSNIPNYREFYEKRWFKGYSLSGSNAKITFAGEKVLFGTKLVFNFDKYFKLALEVCEDLWSVIPPSSFHALAGATVIANISASNEVVSKSDYRKDLVKSQSAKCIAAYAYTSAGVGESSSDLVFGGHSIISENGTVLRENERFNRDDQIIFADIDCQRLVATRMTESSLGDTRDVLGIAEDLLRYDEIEVKDYNKISCIERYFDPHPFVPSNEKKQRLRCEGIFSIQSTALAKRLEHTGVEKSIIGISGGLDSTLALLVVKEAYKILDRPLSDIIAITMPCFGTSERTYNNSKILCNAIGCALREVNIKNTSSTQMKLIGLKKDELNVTYENVQARQRTMILMNTANKEGGLVIGTGDLSEIALGWSTFNGDHMSMYAVNCGVPKTLIRYLISWVAENSDKTLKNVLSDIIDTPVSPELLPPDKKGEIAQKTEDIIGPYELHDFFLYHIVKYGADPEKIIALALIAFESKYSLEIISKYLRLFIKRFFSQQFKRNCVPDGPKVGTIALSPRGDWRMPSDSSAKLWIDYIE